MKRILFIGHDGGRSGAPLVLLHFLRCFKEDEADTVAELLLLRGGELEEQYSEVVDSVRVLPDDVVPSLADRVASRVTGRRESEIQRKIRLSREASAGVFDVVLGNTVASLEFLDDAKSRGCRRTICWLHELDFVVDSFFARERFLELSRSVDHFICASAAVKRMLDARGVTTPSTVVHEFVAINAPRAADEIDAVRAELGLPSGGFVVGGSGPFEWRKGIDLFLQLAAAVGKRDPAMRFLWIGGSVNDSNEFRKVEHDLVRMGLKDRILFTGFTHEPERYLSAIDAFALTSREDPFPLVCLEAAAFAKPILCFAEAGGMPEFVGADAGVVIPYLDIEAFADALLNLSADDDLRQRLGARAREKVSHQFDGKESCRSIAEIIAA